MNTAELTISISFLIALIAFGLISFRVFIAVLDEFRKLIKQAALDLVEIRNEIVNVNIKEQRDY